MIKEIVAALDRQDYGTASQLIQALPPDDPWGQLYRGQLHEAQQALDLAETAYRGLLQADSGPKITRAAREGLQRLTKVRETQRQQQLATTLAQAGKTDLGVLVLEPMPTAAKTQAARDFAQIMQIDPYSARLLIPSQGWRLYRSGPIGELQLYGQELLAAGIPVFWQSLKQLQGIEVYQVCYFETVIDPARVTITTQDGSGQTRSFRFFWSDVTQQVKGLVPIFEEVVDLDNRGKLQRKEQIQDHAQFCDLHLPERSCILRFYDVAYQFNQGVQLTATTETTNAIGQSTSWANWRGLMGLFDQHVPDVPLRSEFTSFAETAVDQIVHLGNFESHINLFRRIDSEWDQAFQLYSSLAFLRHLSEKRQRFPSR